MSSRILNVLDLYCCAGGAAMGYHLAAQSLGIELRILGIDIKRQPNYPFMFLQDDALHFLDRYGDQFAFVHASPVCQGYSRTASLHKNDYDKSIPDLRDLLFKIGVPYVIENVPGAPLDNPVSLDGPMFDLRVIRRRLFECSLPLLQHAPGIKKGTVGGKNSTRKKLGYYFMVGGHQTGTLKEWRGAMGIDWMNKQELAQAVPPAYTNFIGAQVFAHLDKLKP